MSKTIRSNGAPPWAAYTKRRLWEEIEWQAKIIQQLQELLAEKDKDAWQETFDRFAARRKSREAIKRMKRQSDPENVKRDDEIVKLRETRDAQGRRMKFVAIASRLGMKTKAVQVAYRARKERLAELEALAPPRETKESRAEINAYLTQMRHQHLARLAQARRNGKR